MVTDTRSIDVDNGRLHAVRTGDGPPVLMIQGVGVGLSGWGPQVASLSDRFSIIAYDNRGVGRSTHAGGPLSIALMAQDAVAVLDAFGVDRAHVVGHSMGGVIACEVALCTRARVQSLGLLCT